MILKRLTERRTVAVLSVCVAVAAGAAVPILTVTSAEAATGLALAAETSGRYFGSATDNPELSDSAYVSTLTGGEFDQLTPGNTLKWETTEPTQGQFSYTQGDTVVNLGLQNNMKVRGHTLVWHSQLAGWVSSLATTQVQAAMENHITNEVTHFKGKVFAWDVVNEPFNEDGTFRTSVFYNAMGSAYIADALKTARAADPTVKLYINDYNIEGIGAKSDAMYALAKSLVAQGVPLDGIGIQGHLAVQYGFPTNMRENLQRFADLGLDVAITELDVRMQLPEDTTKAATQQTYYTNVVNACLAVTRCVGITLWDYTDKYSWVPSVFSGEGNPLPWDANLNKKQALYNAILSALGGKPASTAPPSSGGPSSGQPSSSGTTGGCRVTYATSVWGTGLVANVTIANTSTTAINGWSLVFTLPSGQTITSGWNATYSPTSGQVTAKNVSYNAAIAANASTNIGFQASHTGNSGKPTSFTLNGAACTVA